MNKYLTDFFKQKADVAWTERKLEYACAVHKVTLLQYYILHLIVKEPMPSSDVANEIPWRDSAITATLDQLETAGLVRRERQIGGDMRVKYLTITDEGKAVLKKVEKDLDNLSVSLKEDNWFGKKASFSPE
jgi:DNA-binding MarR family transcriptional regulator